MPTFFRFGPPGHVVQERSHWRCLLSLCEWKELSWLLTVGLAVLCLPASNAGAKLIVVDNRIGDDRNDGLGTGSAELGSGPVRTLERGALLVGPGDILEIVNNGQPYYGSLRLIGGRCSGVPSLPVIVKGNGVTLDGSLPVAMGDWESLGNEIWRLIPKEKGFYRLVRGEDSVTETPLSATAAATIPTPLAGQWTLWQGAIYYHALPDEIPFLEPFRLATKEAGIFLYQVHHVVVQDMTVRYFRLDGVSAHDQVSDTVLRNITCEGNGRSGLFAGGCSKLVAEQCTLRNNRVTPLLIREIGTVDVQNSALDAEPMVRD